MIRKLCGIYIITNTKNKKEYIGSSHNLEYRWLSHKSLFCRNKHHNPHLQNAWNKYGADAFAFQIICEVPEKQLLQTEQIFLDALQSYKREYGYNIAQFASSPGQGRKHTEETKRKISIANKGKSPNVTTREKLSAAVRASWVLRKEGEIN